MLINAEDAAVAGLTAVVVAAAGLRTIAADVVTKREEAEHKELRDYQYRF